MQAKMIPSLEFENAKEAIDYYKAVFGASHDFRISPTDEQISEYGIVPATSLEDMTIHGGFSILGLEINCADAFMGKPVSSTRIALKIEVNAKDSESNKAIEALYARLANSDQVKITMPFADQIWGGKMGQVVDQYGVTWILNAVPMPDTDGVPSSVEAAN